MKIFIIIRNQKPFTASIIYTTEQAAHEEAKRLAKKFQAVYFVFQAISAFGPGDIRQLSAEEIRQLPCPLEFRV